MSALRERLAAPFAHPKGLLGRIAARAMLATNGPLSDWALELLALDPADRVLEVGFGPGELVRQMAEQVVRGRVAGIDSSALMVRQATKRNAAQVQSGLVSLAMGSVSALPYEDGSFDKVVTVNSIHFWPEMVQGLREVGRVLRTGGRLVVVVLDHRASDDAAIVELRSALVEAVLSAGFTIVSQGVRPSRPRPTVAITASWPG
jgi:ubiquinone/menaquinone biosynthesis C-methylase UbiE